MPIAESLGVTALEWVASTLVTDLINKIKELLGQDIAKGLEDLETTLLPQFQLTIRAAQNSPHADRLNLWLARLKNAYYDAEAILHDHEYERLRCQVEGAVKKRKRTSLAELTSRASEMFSQLMSSDQKSNLLQRLNTLKEVAIEAKEFRDLLGVQTSNGNGICSFRSAFLGHKVFGRDKIRDEIIKFLLEEQETDCSRSCYSVVVITGCGGRGKTTLAQYVYSDERVREHFGVERMLWLSLYHQKNIDIRKRTREMIECLETRECPDLLNETQLQGRLIRTLPYDKAVLLVLDDVWYDKDESESEQWDELLKPFHSLGGRFKIVLTSRSNSFPRVLHPGKHIPLELLEDDDFQKLFMHHALYGLENNQQLNNLNDLRGIGHCIAKKMIKSPLVAKVVGNQLSDHPNTRFWNDTENNVNLSEVVEVLRWSYERWDVQLQRCFLFFAIFPIGSVGFTASEMVQYWVALDFIQHSSYYNENSSVEDIGLNCFEKMVANSVCKLVDKWYIIDESYHDLAEKLSVGYCLRVTDSEKAIPEDIAHLFFKVSNENLKEKLRSIPQLPNLRTLILGNPLIEDQDMSEIFYMISTKFKNLRVLDIWSRGYKILPTAVGDMRNLRCLKVYMSSLEKLPDSMSHLYHLQFVVLPDSIKTLPVKLSNLIKLRSIEKYDSMVNYVHTLPPISNLGKLTSLQRLSEFHVMKEEGYEVGQLGSLREIRGSMRILDVENVRDKDDAAKARLFEKSKLEELELVWGQSVDSVSEVDVIEALRPPENLQLLKIDGYKGSNYPTWLQEHSILVNITHVSFHNCNTLSSLPSNFHQFCYCSTLVLENLGALKQLSCFPENLASLRINKCPSLILVRENELQVDMNQLAVMMERRLIILKFFSEIVEELFDHEIKSFEQTGSPENCPEQFQIIQNAHLQVDDAREQHLSELGFIPTPLKVDVNWAWWRCHQQRMHFIFSNIICANKLILPTPRLRILQLGYCCISDGALSDCMKGMTALKELHLDSIMTITTLPPAQVLQSLDSLRVLVIQDCWCLISLGGLCALPQLQELDIGHCFLLQTTGAQLPPYLQSFTIQGCSLGTILNGNLPRLQNLRISNCHVSRFLSFRALASLKSLHLINCSSLFLIEGLETRPFIDTLAIVQVPNLDLESVVKCWQGCRHLQISSPVILDKLLSTQDFHPPQILWMNRCKEEVLTFQISDRLPSIMSLSFKACKTKNLPTLSDFSSLENIIFTNCLEISELPQLPDSVQYIEINGCPILKERCQPNGPDWHKIQHIKYSWIN